MSKQWKSLKRTMSPLAQARVEARIDATLKAMPLAEIRKAIGMTQAELAGKLDIAQGSVSKCENAADMYLTTLRKYVEALGGTLHLTATFPKGGAVKIARLPGSLARKRA